MVSLSCKAKDINYNVIVFEWIFLAKVSIVFRIPEATCWHMETTVTFLQDDHVCGKLQIFVYILQQFNDDLTCVIAPLLCFFAVIVSDFECLENHIINFFFYRWSHFMEGYCLRIRVWLLGSSIICVVHLNFCFNKL